MLDNTSLAGTSTLPQPDLVSLLSRQVIGQATATRAIVPYVYMYQSGLAPEGRPAGVFLLLGPTGTGKTKTVAAIAELLHGSEKKVLQIDCGEFQMEHEIARLIGAPPGYLGHRETVPMINQQALLDVTSSDCDLALVVLFDEIEKGAQSLTRLLLGILDKGILRLGDNTSVNFEKSLIFFTSNLGAREMLREMNHGIGFQSALPRDRTEVAGKLAGIALGAVRKRFPPEFVNRIDEIVTYRPLDTNAIETILDNDIRRLQNHLNARLGDRCFEIEVSPESRQFLLSKGVSEEYGARELKRTIQRELTQALATMVARGEIPAGAHLNISLNSDGQTLVIEPSESKLIATSPLPTILIVDDNRDLLLCLATELEEQAWNILTAETAADARRLFSENSPTAVLIDYVLGEDDGLRLGLQLQRQVPETQVIIMTGEELSEQELRNCEERYVPILYKPFPADAVMGLVRSRLPTPIGRRVQLEADARVLTGGTWRGAGPMGKGVAR